MVIDHGKHNRAQEEPKQLPGGLVIAAPANDILLKQSGVFALLVVWTLVQVWPLRQRQSSHIQQLLLTLLILMMSSD